MFELLRHVRVCVCVVLQRFVVTCYGRKIFNERQYTRETTATGRRWRRRTVRKRKSRGVKTRDKRTVTSVALTRTFLLQPRTTPLAIKKKRRRREEKRARK